MSLRSAPVVRSSRDVRIQLYVREKQVLTITLRLRSPTLSSGPGREKRFLVTPLPTWTQLIDRFPSIAACATDATHHVYDMHASARSSGHGGAHVHVHGHRHRRIIRRMVQLRPRTCAGLEWSLANATRSQNRLNKAGFSLANKYGGARHCQRRRNPAARLRAGAQSLCAAGGTRGPSPPVPPDPESSIPRDRACAPAAAPEV
jgi:hypothetical protein